MHRTSLVYRLAWLCLRVLLLLLLPAGAGMMLALSSRIAYTLLQTPTPPCLPHQANRIVVLLLTFLCYTAYHASRKPPSIVKSVLHGDTSADENGETSVRALLQFRLYFCGRCCAATAARTRAVRAAAGAAAR